MPVSRSILFAVITVITVVIVTSGVAAPAFAFHSGGVAACSGCHTMHASQDGGPAPGWTPGGNPDLLKYGSATDTCLRCHAARGQLAGGSGYGPGDGTGYDGDEPVDDSGYGPGTGICINA